jgi:hypothetical protein
MMGIARIPPNFNWRDFDTEDEALNFLRQFGFEPIIEKSGYTVWETSEKPTVRANIFLDKDGTWVVARQRRKIG